MFEGFLLLAAAGGCWIGIGVSVSLVILKERFARLSLAGLAGVCAGIIFISIK